jgi:iron complex outermembrane receptor protein
MGWLDYSLKSGLHQFYPPGFAGNNPITGQPFYPDGMIGSPNYEERKYRAGAEFNFNGMDDHEWLFGFEWLYTDSGDTYAIRNFSTTTFIGSTTIPAPAPLGVYRGDANWLEEGLTRRVWGVYAQDQYSLSEKTTITAGMRFDSYDDVGSSVSPRLAAVYRLNEKNTFKAQYARAFRPPTFLETSTKNNPVVIGSPDIESELIDNYELGYIFNDTVNMLRTTVFRADLHSLIVIDSMTNQYANEGKVSVIGAELEYARKFSHTFKLDSSLAVLEAIEAETEAHVADVGHVIGNLGLMYQPRADYILTAQYRTVGKRERAAGDPRDSLKGYEMVDLSATVQNLWMPGLSLRAGVKNLFDADVRFPSPLVSFGGAVIPSYPEDYPRPGREVWMQMELEF